MLTVLNIVGAKEMDAKLISPFQSLIITDRCVEIWNISGMASVWGWGYVCMPCLKVEANKTALCYIGIIVDIQDSGITIICEVELVWVYIDKCKDHDGV